MLKNIRDFFRSKGSSYKSTTCPECKSILDIEEISSDIIFEYYEIKRKYKCRKCKKEYNSLELIVLNGEIQSLTDELHRLYNSINTFHSALSVLLNAAKKLNEAQKSGIYNGPAMN